MDDQQRNRKILYLLDWRYFSLIIAILQSVDRASVEDKITLFTDEFVDVGNWRESYRAFVSVIDLKAATLLHNCRNCHPSCSIFEIGYSRSD